MLQGKKIVCPDCESMKSDGLDRRDFLKTVTAAATAAAAGGVTLWPVPRVSAAPSPSSKAETVVKALYETLTDAQKKEVCFDWDFKDSRGLLRTHVSNNWHITKPTVDSDFFTKDQKALVLEVFKGVFNP